MTPTLATVVMRDAQIAAFKPGKPKVEKTERAIWTMEDLQKALDVCEDDRLRLAINIAFSCTLRLGELMGLTWDCIDISEEAINSGNAYIRITKELQRVDNGSP